jgi:hypothetical protein
LLAGKNAGIADSGKDDRVRFWRQGLSPYNGRATRFIYRCISPLSAMLALPAMPAFLPLPKQRSVGAIQIIAERDR